MVSFGCWNGLGGSVGLVGLVGLAGLIGLIGLIRTVTHFVDIAWLPGWRKARSRWLRRPFLLGRDLRATEIAVLARPVRQVQAAMRHWLWHVEVEIAADGYLARPAELTITLERLLRFLGLSGLAITRTQKAAVVCRNSTHALAPQQ